MWSSSHLHGPRRSHDQSHNDSKASRSSSPDDGTEPRRRTSSDATPRQTPATTRFLTSANDQDTNRSVLASTTLNSDKSEGFGSSKRLGFFADKLTSSLSGTGKDIGGGTSLKSSLHPSQLLHPHIHSRAESNSSPSPSLTSSAMASSNISPVNKSHTSPAKASIAQLLMVFFLMFALNAKASYGRTYDSKLVSREMHRLGSLVPSALAPQLSTAPSVASLSVPPSGSLSQSNASSTSSTDPWGALHVHVLPLFNGEPLRVPIEDLNILVKRHIQIVVSASPPKAIATLENDASELIASGMVTLNAKLTGVDDEKLVARVVEIWGFFWDQVLTYLEGVLLPLQTDPLLSSLYRAPKSHRTASPTRQSGTKSSISSSNSNTSTYHIDVRSVALKSFRDRVILPPFQRLYNRLSMINRQDNHQETSSYQQPRLQQMLLVLSSESRHLPVTFSLTTPSPQPTAGEVAITDLLHLIHNPRTYSDSRHPKFKNPHSQARTSTFLSGALPRDRRGRVALKGKNLPDLVGLQSPGNDDYIYGEDTPRMGPSSYIVDLERDRERELEALRSPDIESSATRASTGGWGLGAGKEEPTKTGEEEEDEPLDWDQAQAVVERMVGMNPHIDARRRVT
ncbi:Target of rapamycin complex 2 subunit bit61 [Psilocybe cubensis]|uniref:HbrB-domain-containing protein n=2 Tax=Psilocybe cubensis TaxID=181762 RepID=A0A8H7Y4X4_PSICU|nr:Target of rapamycin complex 2 subunit bit61 [Psilocybe cubensis]KAH9485286.1 Target of rapamycin complex 2 subunit bit61 [Psilocybe cubensis]